MKQVYEAQNTVEAHMILNLLEQAGLSGRIDGEYLQSAVGELPAIGMVRVMVEDADYQEAKLIVQELDAQQPIAEQKIEPATKKRLGFTTGLICFLLGVAATVVYYRTPVTEDGIDYNGDGKLDEKWTYVNYKISKTESDRNLDGKIDLIGNYDHKGRIKSAESDDDFDGVFETETYFKNGNAVWERSDTTGDGFKDHRIDFKYGIAETAIFIDPVSKKIIKVEEYGPFNLKRAEVDTTGDGVLDTVYEYDAIGEITSKYNKPIKPIR